METGSENLWVIGISVIRTLWRIDGCRNGLMAEQMTDSKQIELRSGAMRLSTLVGAGELVLGRDDLKDDEPKE